MKEKLIRPNELVKYMGENNYRKFVEEIGKKFDKDKAFFIVAQQLEKSDIF